MFFYMEVNNKKIVSYGVCNNVNEALKITDYVVTQVTESEYKILNSCDGDLLKARDDLLKAEKNLSRIEKKIADIYSDD